jgi:hypothetical protein
MDRARVPYRRRGHVDDRSDSRLERGGHWNAEEDPPHSKGSVVRFAPIAALAVVLIAACASAFSMLIWEPAADPPAAATPHRRFGPVGTNAVRPGPAGREIRRWPGRKEPLLCAHSVARPTRGAERAGML